jgi:hypothetical protein
MPAYTPTVYPESGTGTATQLNKGEKGIQTAQATAEARVTVQEAENIAAEAAEKTESSAALAVAVGNVATKTGVPAKATSEAQFDGVEVGLESIVLLIGQTVGAENGLWEVLSGAWARPASYLTGSVHGPIFVPVATGNAHKGATYITTNKEKITVGTTATTWTENSAGTGIVGTESIGTSQLKNKAVTPAKVGEGVVTNVEKQIAAKTETIKLNLAEATVFNVKLEVPVVKFVIENLPTRIEEFTLLVEWTATGGASTFTIATSGGTLLSWIEGTEPSWDKTATNRAFISILTIGGAELFGQSSGGATITQNLRVNEAIGGIYAGEKAGLAPPTGGGNIFLGKSAGEKTTTGAANIAIGKASLLSNLTGQGNVAIGEVALNKQTSSEATAIGLEALSQNTAANNTAVGAFAAASTTTGTGVLAIGKSALFTNKTGKETVAVGHGALEKATASFNTAVGFAAGSALTTGEANTIMGRNAMGLATTAAQSVAIGSKALSALTEGVHNVAIGYGAGAALTTAGGGVYIGWEAGAAETAAEKLYIHNGASAEPLIKGDFSTRELLLYTTKMGFFKHAAVTQPVVNKTETVEKLNNALKELGLIGGT